MMSSSQCDINRSLNRWGSVCLLAPVMVFCYSKNINVFWKPKYMYLVMLLFQLILERLLNPSHLKKNKKERLNREDAGRGYRTSLNAGWHRQTNCVGWPPVENLSINKNCSSLLYHFHPSNHPLRHHEQEGQNRVFRHAGPSDSACCRNFPSYNIASARPLRMFAPANLSSLRRQSGSPLPTNTHIFFPLK